MQGNDYRLFQGAPYFLQDLRPQSFLGRMAPGKNRDLDLPADILRWTDEQVLKYTSRRSEHPPGDLYGRLPMATFSALDGDLGMMDQHWTAVARELEQLEQLSKQDVQTVEALDLYGALIGNTDRHHGNIAAGLELRHLPLCYQMAIEFWNRVMEDARISEDFKQHVAYHHLTTLRALDPGPTT